EMTAMRQIQPENRVARLQDGEVCAHVGLAAGVRLHIGVLGAKKSFGAVAGQVFDDIGILAAAVIAPAGIAFGVLIGEDRAHGLEHRLADKIFRGNQLQAFVLAGDFLVNGGGDRRIDFGESFHSLQFTADGSKAGNQDPSTRVSRAGEFAREPSLAQDDNYFYKSAVHASLLAADSFSARSISEIFSTRWAWRPPENGVNSQRSTI